MDDDEGEEVELFRIMVFSPKEHFATDEMKERYKQAYMMMAAVGYRPAAPSDGWGNIQLSADELKDEQRLQQEAAKYADNFIEEEYTRKFHIGCAGMENARMFALAIEAARQFCSHDGAKWAVKLWKMIGKEMDKRPKEFVKPECVVYWLHNEACRNPAMDGYVGITWRLTERVKAHRTSFRLYRGIGDFKVKVLFKGTEEQCLAIEEDLRPKPNMGWNIARGGNVGE